MERTGWCWSMLQEIKLLVNTTPSARAKVASRLLFTPRIHPSSAEEGSRDIKQYREASFMPDRASLQFQIIRNSEQFVR